MTKSNKLGFVFKILVLVFFSVLFLLPIYWVLISSFKTDKSIFDALMPFSSKALHFDKQLYTKAYYDIWVSRNFGRAIFNSCLVTIATTILGIFVNAMAAFSFTVFEFKGKNILFVIVLITFMIPFSSIALPLYQICSAFKMSNTYWGLILPAVSNGLCIFLFRQFFLEIPKSYVDAAILDGASWWTVFSKIFMRMSIPIMVSAGIILFMYQWEAFLWPLIIGRSPEMKVIQVAIADLSQDNEVYWNQIFAACSLSLLLPIAIILPLQKYYIMGIASTGVKE